MTDQAPNRQAATTEILHSRRVVSSAVIVLAVTMAIALVSYVWDWVDALNAGEVPEPDEWLGMVGLAGLPYAAVVTRRLVRFERLLTVRERDAVQAFQDTVDNAHGWIWQTDADMRITYSSQGVHTLLGHRSTEVIARTVGELISDETMATPAVDPGGRQDLTTETRHTDGTVRHLSTTVAPMFDESGQTVGYRGFTADVTVETVAQIAQDEHQRRYAESRARIEHALDHPEAMYVVLQPIVDIDGRRIAGMEALARFEAEPKRPPNLWFAEAWEVGLGIDLELHAVDLACRRLPELPPHGYLSINLSAQTLTDPRLLDLLTDLGDQARRVVVEVTEHTAIDDYSEIAGVLDRIRSLGARLAVDDAGAGYASMQHILRLRPDIIKLDRSIVADSDVDPARFALIGAMANFAASLDMVVIAEGVETSGELSALTENQICHAQGYYLARPAVEPLMELAPPASAEAA
ncbi:sensor domain-containing phosphodiesterase [Actinoplanes philippinensis]|uniref:sensor domain-containing phosphodiesterase n=1 Tax=Actinoplanes philippinensis TaxID=35752 RepID=UPI00340FC1EF